VQPAPTQGAITLNSPPQNKINPLHRALYYVKQFVGKGNEKIEIGEILMNGLKKPDIKLNHPLNYLFQTVYLKIIKLT